MLSCIGIWAYSQPVQLSAKAEISILTCGPGNELYTRFGHSAFRVQDPNLDIDVVYNYGTFDFNAPNFYTNFAKGKLTYRLSRERFENFLYTYQFENRWVKEQILDLDTREKNLLFRYLENNYKPENRAYQYDFLYNNCSTKMAYVLTEVFGGKVVYGEDHMNDPKSFRELIRENLELNSWSSLGIDLALGADIDGKAKVYDHMFLPNYVLYQMANTRIDGKPLVKRQRDILDLNNGNNTSFFTISPLFWFLMLLGFVVTITYIDYTNQTRSRWLDLFLFGLTGLAGCLLTFLWFFTDHTSTVNNANVLWAFPLNLILCFYILKVNGLPSWFHRALLALLIFLGLIALLWIMGIQSFAPVLTVLLLALFIRYAYLWWYCKPEPGEEENKGISR